MPWSLKQLQHNFRFYPGVFNGGDSGRSPVKRPDALIGTRTEETLRRHGCDCNKTGYNSRSESISIAVRLEAKERALNCCHSVDRGTSKKKRLLTNYKPEWQAVRPSIGSKGKLRPQFNLHFSHTGRFFYRRRSTVDGAALPFAIQQLCRPLLG